MKLLSCLFIVLASIFTDALAQPVQPKTNTIPSACAYIGSPEYEHHRNADELKHRICINSFELTQHEITVSDFRTFVNATNYITDAEINYQEKGCWSYDSTQTPAWNWYSWANWKSPLGQTAADNDPVTCISFYDISKYIAWLNRTTGEHYRLPTEAEWEYATRAGSNSLYFWGNNPRLSCRYANFADQSAPFSSRELQTFPCNDKYTLITSVKKYSPNKFGLYDMLGNAWEWTCSEYHSDYSKLSNTCVDNENFHTKFIAVRGGGWNSDPVRSRIAYRNWEAPWIRMASWGFRLVKQKKRHTFKRKPITARQPIQKSN